ncbi:hypothetical protein CLV77_1366 [Brevirhabdus pacifica]|uniref:hypothetical protein n=1 Tax=Brevirhabdus pacifica TaxID=1267768 RepID=UPI000CBBE758|nr:hypothetical protein [Brevirhabdus pacifica]PJJ86808.1 hypothetical protein CLV77_1366 [Brevirhabdus pacifica]
MTHPLERSQMRRLFERMNAPQMFRDCLLGWFLAALTGLGLVVTVSSILAIRWPL